MTVMCHDSAFLSLQLKLSSFYSILRDFSIDSRAVFMRVSHPISPDQRRQSAALPVASMRIEPLAIRERAPLPAADIRHAQRQQPQARKTDEIRLPAAARIHPETRTRGPIGFHENLAHLIAHFKMLLRDRGT